MKPKLNKLIMLLLLLSNFAFLMETEERVTEIAKKELSEWASLLPNHQTNIFINSTESNWIKINLLEISSQILLKADSSQVRSDI